MGPQPVVAAGVEHQRAARSPPGWSLAGDDLLDAGHLRHPPRVDELTDLDPSQPGVGRLHGPARRVRPGRKVLGLHLQAVTRTDVDDLDRRSPSATSDHLPLRQVGQLVLLPCRAGPVSTLGGVLAELRPEPAQAARRVGEGAAWGSAG